MEWLLEYDTPCCIHSVWNKVNERTLLVISVDRGDFWGLVYKQQFSLGNTIPSSGLLKHSLYSTSLTRQFHVPMKWSVISCALQERKWTSHCCNTNALHVTRRGTIFSISFETFPVCWKGKLNHCFLPLSTPQPVSVWIKKPESPWACQWCWQVKMYH